MIAMVSSFKRLDNAKKKKKTLSYLTNHYSIRLYGCYENISGPGCSTTRALQDLTGGIVQSFGLSNQDRFLTYQVLNSAVPRSSLLISTITLVSEIQRAFWKTMRRSAVFAYFRSLNILTNLTTYIKQCVAEGEQETTEATERSNDSARIQRHGSGTSPGSVRRHPASKAEKSMGRRRMDRTLERKKLGVGRAVWQRQGASQRPGAKRW